MPFQISIIFDFVKTKKQLC